VPQLGRIAFLGTGSFGVPLLSQLPALCDELLVISQPDRPAGRGLETRASPVAAWAREHRVAVQTPRRLRSDEGRALLTRFGSLAGVRRASREDLVAAVGLWLAAAWGAVVWLTAAVSMAAVEVFFPQVYGGRMLVVAVEFLLLFGYLFLAIQSAREHPN